MTGDNNLVLLSSAVLFKKDGKEDLWFLVKQSEEDEWEMPRTVVRKGESSIRAAIRMMGEQGTMTVRVLEEAGRAGGVTNINNKTVPQRHLYYLVRYLSDSGEAIGFDEFVWLKYAQAVRKLTSKRERLMLKAAKKELKEWRKKKEQRRKAKKEAEKKAEELTQ